MTVDRVLCVHKPSLGTKEVKEGKMSEETGRRGAGDPCSRWEQAGACVGRGVWPRRCLVYPGVLQVRL